MEQEGVCSFIHKNKCKNVITKKKEKTLRIFFFFELKAETEKLKYTRHTEKIQKQFDKRKKKLFQFNFQFYERYTCLPHLVIEQLWKRVCKIVK